MEAVNQKYVATVQVYRGRKVVLGNGHTLKFRPDRKGFYTELDCRIFREGQKTLSSMKPSEVTIESELTARDIGGKIIMPGESFTISDGYDKIGKGKITEVVKQI